ncbi:MAG: sel1 repeat family protein, partial [Asticcacaulis sp.]|nr:sel1 repeat family protein [Asticcacaulis sp.]
TVMGDHAYAQGDLVQARTWYTGNADFSLRSLVRLAQMVEAGEGGPRDVQEAAWLYSVAAQEGSPDAAEWLKGRAETAALPHIKPDLDGHDLAVKMNFVWKGQPGRDVYVAQTLELFIPPKGHDEFDIVHMEVTCYVTAGHRIDICLTTGPDIGGAYSRALRDAYSGDIVVPDSDRDGQATASTLYSRPICYGFHCG